MAPAQAARLTWCEFDAIGHGHARAQQRALEGPRLLAWQTYNVNAEAKDRFDSPADYLPLDLIDAPRPPKGPTAEGLAAFLERRARAGRAVELESI